MKKNIALPNNKNKELAKKEIKVGFITYQTLAERVGDMVLCNRMENRVYDNLLPESGDMTRYYDENGNELTKEETETYEYQVTEETIDIYQWYIISDSGANYLMDITDEIVFYDSELDIYVWGITHWGTSWDYVFTNIKATENVNELLETEV